MDWIRLIFWKLDMEYTRDEKMTYNDVYAIDDEDWYYIVRSGSNERLLNKSGDINVCKRYHLQYILPKLNIYDKTWYAITIADYNRKFRNVI